MTKPRSRWLALTGWLTVTGLLPAACDRNPAAQGSYAWTGGGEAGAPDPEAKAGNGGTGGESRATGGASATGEKAAAGAGSKAPGGSGAPAGGRAGSSAGGKAGGPLTTDDSSGQGGAGEGGAGGSSDEAGEGGAAGARPDPCADSPDTDEDGVTDACDDDDDDDGYPDLDDSAPLDPTAPGGLVAPGTILNDACVKNVLAELAELDMTMPIHREQFPPNQDGYYVRAEGTGMILAGNDGVTVGLSTTGMEARVKSIGLERFDSAVVDFSLGAPKGYGVGRGNRVRGLGDEFTHFGSTASFVLMYSARRSPSGSWLEGFYLSILLPTTGMPHAECPAGAGKYRFSDAPLTARVEVTELNYMCVDEDAAYAPTERWTRSGGDSCQCTTSYQVSCDPP